MSKEVYRYGFSEEVPLDEVEETIHLSLIAAECLHGPTRVRLDASYCLCKKKHACVVCARTNVGLDVVSLLTGFLTREYGEDAFTVECVPIKCSSKSPALSREGR